MWPCTKSECVDFFQYMFKQGNFENFEFDYSFIFSCIHHLFPPPNKKIIKVWLQQYFSSTGRCLFLLKHLFCLFHRKTRWTMSMANVDLKIICLLGTSHSMVTFTFSSLVWTEVVLGGVLQPITNLQGLGTTSWSMVKTTPKRVSFMKINEKYNIQSK